MKGCTKPWTPSTRAAAGLAKHAGCTMARQRRCMIWRPSSMSLPSGFAKSRSRRCKRCVACSLLPDRHSRPIKRGASAPLCFCSPGTHSRLVLFLGWRLTVFCLEISPEFIFNQWRCIDLRHMALRAVVTQCRTFRQDLALTVAEVAVANLWCFLLLVIGRAVTGQALVFFERDFVEVLNRMRNHGRLAVEGARYLFLPPWFTPEVLLGLGRLIDGSHVSPAHRFWRLLRQDWRGERPAGDGRQNGAGQLQGLFHDGRSSSKTRTSFGFGPDRDGDGRSRVITAQSEGKDILRTDIDTATAIGTTRCKNDRANPLFLPLEGWANDLGFRAYLETIHAIVACRALGGRHADRTPATNQSVECTDRAEAATPTAAHHEQVEQENGNDDHPCRTQT